MALPSMIRAAGALAAPLVVSVMNRYSRVSLVVNALTGHRWPVGGTSIRAHLTTSSLLAEARQRHAAKDDGLTFFAAAVIVPAWIAG